MWPSTVRRASRIAAHWEFALAPRQIEYYRMPMMAYLAVDNPRALSRSEFIRLGLVTGAGEMVPRDAAALAGLPDTDPKFADPPRAEQQFDDFEQRFCYDRFWAGAGAAPHTRYLCSGLSLVVVVTTGFLGMNLFAEADASTATKLGLFLVVFVLTVALTMYTMVKSKRLSDFLDVVSDDRMSAWRKVSAFFAVWGRRRD